MVEVICDNCGTIKKSNHEWILGNEQQKHSLRSGSVRKLIRFFDRWYSRQATELGAIHLCSVKCKEEFARTKGMRVIITQRDLSMHNY